MLLTIPPASEKITHKWKKMFVNHMSDKELVSRIYKELLQLNNKKIKNSFFNEKKIWIDMCPKKVYKWPISP